MNAFQDPDCPAGCERVDTGAAFGRRCLLSTQAGQRERNQLRPAKANGGATYYRTQDLDRIRNRQFSALQEKFSRLTSDEAERLKLLHTETHRLAAGRSFATNEDRQAGAQAAADWVAASTELRQTMAAQRQAAEGYASAAVQLSQGVNQMTAVVSTLSSQMQALTGLLKRYAMAKSANR